MNSQPPFFTGGRKEHEDYSKKRFAAKHAKVLKDLNAVLWLIESSGVVMR